MKFGSFEELKIWYGINNPEATVNCHASFPQHYFDTPEYAADLERLPFMTPIERRTWELNNLPF